VGFVSSAEEFVEFAAAASPRLRRMAFLLCGDWHTAEDLVQTTLAKVFVSWRKIRRREAEHAYASRTLVNTYLAGKRLKRSEEILTSNLPRARDPVTADQARAASTYDPVPGDLRPVMPQRVDSGKRAVSIGGIYAE
jgi:DNA-directed RNA polymerase specialized sigma24 family protein